MAFNNINHFKYYKTAESKINQSLIRLQRSLETPQYISRDDTIKKGNIKLNEYKKFLLQLDNPQNNYPIILIGGSSGKGTVTTILAKILTSLGFKTGLHISPYLQVAVEKFMINNKLILGKQYLEIVDKIYPVALDFLSQNSPASVHGMASLSIALEYFKNEKVDYAVIEAGCGGRFDFTNVLPRILSIITTVGYDHVDVLGPQLNDIAFHKAGLIYPDTPVVSGVCGEQEQIIKDEAEQKNALYKKINPQDDYMNFNKKLVCESLKLIINKKYSINDLNGLIDDSRILPGRWESVEDGKIILDGAHNSQKIEAVVKRWKKQQSGKPLILFGMIKGRQPLQLLEILKTISDDIFITKPQVYGKKSYDVEEIEIDAKKIGFKIRGKNSNPEDALKEAMNLLKDKQKLFITGSLYLVGNVRQHWYIDRNIVTSRNPWVDSNL